MLRKAGGNWVDGDRFFDRIAELDALAERCREGTHTLLTAQRRMGKTSLVRELLRRFKASGEFETIFVNVEDSLTAADAIAEIGTESSQVQNAWERIRTLFANQFRDIAARVESLESYDLKVKLRAGIDSGNWRPRGHDIFQALANSEKPVVLAIDELPILVNRLLKGHDYRITFERKQEADEIMSWLRKMGQEHRGDICMILSGSVSLEPILRQAGLSAHANIYRPLELKPWDERTAVDCLGELAKTYGLVLPPEVSQNVCQRLRCGVPHHVQGFFDRIHENLRLTGRTQVTLQDVDTVYNEMLGIRGQTDLEHYEGRLKMVLGNESYLTALELLTETAVNSGHLSDDTILEYRKREPQDGGESVEGVLYVLEHDGYLARQEHGYRFVSGLLEDWWRARHGHHFTPINERGRRP